jgi:hypothetical protein
MNLRAVGCLLMSLVLMPAVSAGQHATNLNDVDLAVLKVVLDAERHASPDGFIVLSSTPAVPGSDADIGDADNSGAVDNLKHRSQIKTALPSSLTSNGVHLLSDHEIQQVTKRVPEAPSKESLLNKGWEPFYAAFPGSAGLMRISLPGYTAAGDIAVVYTNFECGKVCGKGEYVYLRRVNGDWQVLVRLRVWIS